MERYEIITDNGGKLIEIRNLADGDTCWCRRSRLQNVGGGEYALVSQERAKTLRAQYTRKQSGIR